MLVVVADMSEVPDGQHLAYANFLQIISTLQLQFLVLIKEMLLNRIFKKLSFFQFPDVI